MFKQDYKCTSQDWRSITTVGLQYAVLGLQLGHGRGAGTAPCQPHFCGAGGLWGEQRMGQLSPGRRHMCHAGGAVTGEGQKQRLLIYTDRKHCCGCGCWWRWEWGFVAAELPFRGAQC